MAGKWEGFTQASQLKGLAVTTDHQPPPSMEDQLCRGRVGVLLCGQCCPLGVAGPGISWVVQAKVTSHLCSAQRHPSWAIEQSEMAVTCAGLGDYSQVKPSCKARLDASSFQPGAT